MSQPLLLNPDVPVPRKPPRRPAEQPRSLLEFQRAFPDEAACADYMERVRWPDGFACPSCGVASEPYRFATRPAVLRCRACQHDTSLTAGTVMHKSKMDLQVWLIEQRLDGRRIDRRSDERASRHDGYFRCEHRRRGVVIPERQLSSGGQSTDHRSINHRESDCATSDGTSATTYGHDNAESIFLISPSEALRTVPRRVWLAGARLPGAAGLHLRGPYWLAHTE